jgi:hypothetical protein
MDREKKEFKEHWKNREDLRPRIIITTNTDTIQQWRIVGGGGDLVGSTPPKFRSFDKAKPNSQFRGKYIPNDLIRIRVSPICKLSGTPD